MSYSQDFVVAAAAIIIGVVTSQQVCHRHATTLGGFGYGLVLLEADKNIVRMNTTHFNRRNCLIIISIHHELMRN